MLWTDVIRIVEMTMMKLEASFSLIVLNNKYIYIIQVMIVK